MRILEAAHSRDGASGGQPDGADFWSKALRDLLSNAIGALFHAYGRVSLNDLIKLIHSVPSSEEQATDPDFQSWSFCYSTMRRVFDAPSVPLPLRDAAQYVTYFGKTFGRLDARTRSNIIITLDSEISPFLRGTLHQLFCTDTNFDPEATHHGAIIVLDLPIKRFEQTGVVAQMLFKYLWQKATERRMVQADTRPVFLYADEAQLFISGYDLEFQSTARSARAATVYITQNLPSLYTALGGRHPQDRADAIIGNFQTKIFHSNSDYRTNQWAADMIGRQLHRWQSANWSESQSSQTSEGNNGSWGVQHGTNRGGNSGSSFGGSYSNGHYQSSWNVSSGKQSGKSESRSKGGGWSIGSSESDSDSKGGGWSEQMDHVLQPSFFANGLRQGGDRNNRHVSAVFLQANRVFSRTGACWTPVVFKQE